MITKEAIEAAKRANTEAKLFGDEPDDWVRAALEAALPFLPIAGEGKVKELGWISIGEVTFASTPFGSYEVRWNSTSPSTDLFELVIPGEKVGFKTFDDEESAKAAAQADYNTRILSALISSPAKDGGQEVDYEAIMKSALVAADSEYAIGPDETAFKRAIEAAVNWSFLALSNAQPASTALVEALEVARDQIITMYRTWVVDDATAMPTEISLAGRAVAKIDAALSASTSREGGDAQD